MNVVALAPQSRTRMRGRAADAAEPAGPRDLVGERSLLGRLIIEPAKLADVAFLRPDDFYRYTNQLIYSALDELHHAGASIDLITLKNFLAQAGNLQRVGGWSGLAKLVDGVPRGTDLASWAEGISRDGLQRRRIAAADRIARAARDGLELAESIQDLVQLNNVAQDVGSFADDDVSILNEPEQPEQWAGRWQLGSLVAVIGEPGDGKSLLTDEFATCSALAEPCLGAEIPRPGGTLIIPLEGRGGLKRRLRASKEHHGVALNTKLGIHYWKRPFSVTDGALVDEVVEFVRHHPIRTVRIETWARLMGASGLDENAASDVAMALGALARLQDLDATVIVIHHLSANKSRERGSTALRAAADTVLKIELEVARNGRRKVTCEKSRDLLPFRPFRFRLQAVGRSVVPVLAADDPDVEAAPPPTPTDLDAGMVERARTLVRSHPGLSRTMLAKMMTGRMTDKLGALRYVMAEAQS